MRLCSVRITHKVTSLASPPLAQGEKEKIENRCAAPVSKPSQMRNGSL